MMSEGRWTGHPAIATSGGSGDPSTGRRGRLWGKQRGQELTSEHRADAWDPPERPGYGGDDSSQEVGRRHHDLVEEALRSERTGANLAPGIGLPAGLSLGTAWGYPIRP